MSALAVGVSIKFYFVRGRLPGFQKQLEFSVATVATAASSCRVQPPPPVSPCQSASQKTQPTDKAVSIYQDTAFDGSRCAQPPPVGPAQPPPPLNPHSPLVKDPANRKSCVYLTRHHLLSLKIDTGGSFVLQSFNFLFFLLDIAIRLP